jgi:hypothetical protein
VSDELTIGDFLIGILPRLQNDTTFPWWPPDCFALCLALLKRSGTYAHLLRDWPPSTTRSLGTWTDKVRELGEKWRRSARLEEHFGDLAGEWKIVWDSSAVPLGEILDRGKIRDALITIVAAADEASEGVGGPRDQAADEYDPILDIGSDTLRAFGTLCLEIDGSRLRVLPRMHTPQNGLTERSLSHYLSLYEASEATPQWLSNSFLRSDSVNLLLIPWPLEVRANQFRETVEATARLPKGFGFFTFTDDSAENLTARVEALHAEATQAGQNRRSRPPGAVDHNRAVSRPSQRSTSGMFPYCWCGRPRDRRPTGNKRSGALVSTA